MYIVLHGPPLTFFIYEPGTTHFLFLALVENRGMAQFSDDNELVAIYTLLLGSGYNLQIKSEKKEYNIIYNII